MTDERIPLERRIEHTILRPDATESDVRRAYDDATAWGCFGLCVQPYWVGKLDGDASLTLISVAGFPFGVERRGTKAAAAACAVEDGASEIDIVINLGALKSGDWRAVASDIASVRRAIPDAHLKVILETGLLSRDETERAARVCMQEGADFLKTCTGYGPRGVTVEDVALLAAIGPVKASAGIGTRNDAEALVAAGADRLGCSRTAAIVGHA